MTGTTAAIEVTGVILAGGAGRRVGGRDKGLVSWQGRPLVEHMHARLAPQVDEVIISCNRNLAHYRRYTKHIVTDSRGDFAGPLAGLEAAAAEIHTTYAVIVACDTPLIPACLATRLLAPLSSAGEDIPDICFVHDGTREHYLCAALRREILPTLAPFLDAGGRAVREWYSSHRSQAVDFSDHATAFRNVNTLP